MGKTVKNIIEEINARDKQTPPAESTIAPQPTTPRKSPAYTRVIADIEAGSPLLLNITDTTLTSIEKKELFTTFQAKHPSFTIWGVFRQETCPHNQSFNRKFYLKPSDKCYLKVEDYGRDRGLLKLSLNDTTYCTAQIICQVANQYDLSSPSGLAKTSINTRSGVSATTNLQSETESHPEKTWIDDKGRHHYKIENGKLDAKYVQEINDMIEKKRVTHIITKGQLQRTQAINDSRINKRFEVRPDGLYEDGKEIINFVGANDLIVLINNGPVTGLTPNTQLNKKVIKKGSAENAETAMARAIKTLLSEPDLRKVILIDCLGRQTVITVYKHPDCTVKVELDDGIISRYCLIVPGPRGYPNSYLIGDYEQIELYYKTTA